MNLWPYCSDSLHACSYVSIVVGIIFFAAWLFFIGKYYKEPPVFSPIRVIAVTAIPVMVLLFFLAPLGKWVIDIYFKIVPFPLSFFGPMLILAGLGFGNFLKSRQR